MGEILSNRDLYAVIPFRIFQRPPQQLLPTTVLAEVGKGSLPAGLALSAQYFALVPAWFLVSYREHQLRDPSWYYF